MEMIGSDDECLLEQTMFCPDCGLPLYQTDGDIKFFLFRCRACGYEDQLDYHFSWEDQKVNNISTLPRVKRQRPGACVPNAMVTAIDSKLKFFHAKDKNSSENLSVHDLMEQYEQLYEQKLGPGFKWTDGHEGYDRIDWCKEICEENGVLTAKAFQSKEQDGNRCKARATRKKKSSFLASCKRILKGNVLFTTIPITEQFQNLKGDEIYIADESLIKVGGKRSREHHAIVLVGFGRLNKVDYFRLMNSHGTTFGNRGFANVRAKEVKDITHFDLLDL